VLYSEGEVGEGAKMVRHIQTHVHVFTCGILK